MNHRAIDETIEYWIWGLCYPRFLWDSVPIKVAEGVNVHIHLRDSYRKDVKNVVINIKDKLDMVSVVEKTDVFVAANIAIEKN